MRIVKCRVMQSVRLWLSDSGRKLAVANGQFSPHRPWCVDVYDLHSDEAPAGLGGGITGRVIDGFDADDRLRVIPGKAFPLNLGGMTGTEVNRIYLHGPTWLIDQTGTVAPSVVLSADGRRCVASVGYYVRLFTKRAGGKWAENWQREVKDPLGGPIRFLKNDTRFTLTASAFVRNAVRYNLLVWDTRTGREVDRTADGSKPFAHVVSVGKQLVVAINREKLPQGEVLAYDSNLLGREPQQVLASESPIAAVCADPLGRFVLIATAQLVTQWDPTTWLPIRTFNWKIGTITCLTVNSTGTVAAAGGHQGKVAVWDVE